MGWLKKVWAWLNTEHEEPYVYCPNHKCKHYAGDVW